MPSTRQISKEQPSPRLLKQQTRFEFPSDSHLLVTTASHIYSWDATGVHTIFKSSKNSIVAAREAKDGSGVLAVADKRVVVLHDTKRGQQRSWGLEANDDEVRHLEYTLDAKSLFLSTNLTADIHRYSTERSKLLTPSRAHASPPIALAISPTGHLLVSASDNPPVVYLKDLKQNSTPTLIESQASGTAVSKIAFHPERPNIFLLAFRDGTVASFDATNINRNRVSSFVSQEDVNAGEISRLSRLHRTTSEAVNAHSISDAAFLPGYKTRAITTGSDGRCRLIDFADGGVILRTWHAKAPVKSISILSQKSEAESRKISANSRSSHVMGGPTSTNNVVAVGRADGKVHIYDSLGLLLEQHAFGSSNERIVSVEWAKGKSPKPISDSIISTNVDDLPVVFASRDATVGKVKDAGKISKPRSNTARRRETTFEHVGMPPALRKPKAVKAGKVQQPPRQFTIHPDEVEEGTVRHNPASRLADPVAADQKDYLDLFSPMKPPAEENTQKSPVKQLASPPRQRPRLSPQTFIKSPEPTPASQHDTISKPRNLALFPSTDSSSETAHPPMNDIFRKVNHDGQDRPSPARQGTRITFKPTSQRRHHRISPYRINKPSPNQNAKVLADLRKLNAVHPANQNSGTLVAFASSKSGAVHNNGSLSAKKSALRLFQRPNDHVETDMNSEEALKVYEHVHHKVNWPEDSNQDSSLDEDIWLTSESDNITTCRQKRRRKPAERPPARQTSRARVDSKGTISTVGQMPGGLHVGPKSIKATVDGSTEDDMETAHTHISPSGAFSPSSNDVRDLFPRTSSLSPKKGGRSRKRIQNTEVHLHQPLREVALNSLDAQQAKSPWARVEADKDKPGGQTSKPKQAGTHNISIFEDQHCCRFCLTTRAQMQEIEGEVARLKGEVIALKAVLRRNGIPLPLSMR
jgi:WD40 repeat protein